jgi:RimJ/RimL family protein N-acetyltransferase
LANVGVQAVDSVEEFAGLPGDPEDYAAMVTEMWETGESRPEWCFLLADGSEVVGRVGFLVTPTTTDPAWLGTLPPEELFLFGLHLPWEGDYLAAGQRLITEATQAIAGQVPDILEVRINNSLHPHHQERARLMEEAGMELFQEKHGFTWVDDGATRDLDERLAFRSVAEIGVDAYREVMAPCGEGTLDRNDRYYWSGCGPQNWAAQMTEYLTEEDAEMWLIGYHDEVPVGYVAVAREEDWGATIAHIGIVPNQRGHGYIDDLLAAGNAAVRKSGIGTMLSDVDVLNTPMIRAMERNGHTEDPERWHLWVYRAAVEGLSDIP